MSKEVSKYTPTKEHIQLYEQICALIEFQGYSVRKAINEVGMFNDMFYKTKVS